MHWGDKGYEVEFTRGVGQFDAHLRENGWTNTRMEFFFNHKKRHRWFGWDGDEPKYIKDMGQHQEMIRMWESVTADSPVPWVYRMDASWQMKNQFDMIGGHRNMWVCSGFHRWYPDELRTVTERGEIAWWYTGSPPIGACSSAILALVYQTWERGLSGCCQWSTISPGDDPWFESNGSATCMMYPGDRFGIKGPLPSIRMKVLRNGIQDIDLLDRATKAAGDANPRRAAFTESIPVVVWEKPPPIVRQQPPEEWDSHNLMEDHEPGHLEQKQLDPFWWSEIRDQTLSKETS
jgi:hypothetical protein